MRTEFFSLQVAGGPYFLLLDWFLICFFDGLVVFVQPLALFALVGFSTLGLSGQDQLWFMTGLSLLVNALYRVGMEASPLNASVGMRLFRLRVPYGQWTWRRNPFVRHFAKIVTMPIILMANLIGMPIAYLFFPSDESDPGFYIRLIAGDTGLELLHDSIAQVEFVAE